MQEHLGSYEGPFKGSKDDREIERRVLMFLLDEHPAQATEDEIALALIDDPPTFAGADAIGRALRELRSGGVVIREGEFLVPNRAARYMASLVIE